MYSFHVIVQSRTSAQGTMECQVDGWLCRVLDVSRPVVSKPLAVSFEEAAERLKELPRMFIEPDGSFVQVASLGKACWQVDGQLYDRDGCLLFAEFKGSCPPAAFDRLIGCLGWPETPLMFQLVRQAVYLDESEFRRHASTANEIR